MPIDNSKTELKRLYEALAAVPTVSGFEKRSAERVLSVIHAYLNQACENTENGFVSAVTPSGGILLSRKILDGAPTLLLDAHIDTVGFCVAEITDDGFLYVTPVGGIDKRLLYGREIEIYGKEETIRGIFAANPPHLKEHAVKNADTSVGLPPIDEMPIDTGYDGEALKQIVSIGDPAGFVQDCFFMQNGRLCGRSMDDKICACSILLAANALCAKELPLNLTLSFSSSEEINGTGGAYLGKLCADAAIVLDVNFGRARDIPERESYILGAGCGVSYSCTTDRRLTERLIACAARHDIPLQTMVEPKHTGTNAHFLQNAAIGTPTAVLSIPELYMHAGIESVDCDDVFACAELLCAFAEEFSKTEVSCTKREERL